MRPRLLFTRRNRCREAAGWLIALAFVALAMVAGSAMRPKAPPAPICPATPAT